LLKWRPAARSHQEIGWIGWQILSILRDLELSEHTSKAIDTQISS
jgi:hypothetical protein